MVHINNSVCSSFIWVKNPLIYEQIFKIDKSIIRREPEKPVK